MAIQDLVRWLLPKEDHFYRFLERQAAIAHLGAQALATFTPGSDIQDVQTRVQMHEHEGDKVVYELEDALQKTFVTPIDREDLQKLSAELDDVLDLTNSAARACALFGVKSPTEPMTKMVAVLVKATAELERCLPLLRQHDYAGLMVASRGLRAMEKEADQVFRSALSALFRDDTIDAKTVMREKEVLENLEHAIDRCERVALTLAHLAVKHG